MAQTKPGPGRPPGPALPPLDRIRAAKDRIAKKLLDKALLGDTQAMAECLRLIAEDDLRRGDVKLGAKGTLRSRLQAQPS